jgi:hypothetical protein
MRRFLLILCAGCLVCAPAASQVISKEALDTAQMTLLGRVALGGYVDTYYGYSSDRPASGDIPYFVSSGRHNEFNVNLAYLDILYRSNSLRAEFAPGLGTYMNANYASESGSTRFIVEANAGARVSAKRQIWVDAGIFKSPFTNESPVSKDHLMYSRSLSAEYSPYYITGVRLSGPLGKQVSASVYVVNGWQLIRDNNEGKAVVAQVEYRPTPSLLLNGNTYIGDERSQSDPDFRTRYLLDLYAIYRPDGSKMSGTASTYFGWQERSASPTSSWWQANVIGRYQFNEKVSLSGRLEYYSDPEEVLIRSVTSVNSFRSWSTGLCFNVHLWSNAMFRVEGRHFFGPDAVYETGEGTETSRREWIITSLTAWF